VIGVPEAGVTIPATDSGLAFYNCCKLFKLLVMRLSASCNETLIVQGVGFPNAVPRAVLAGGWTGQALAAGQGSHSDSDCPSQCWQQLGCSGILRLRVIMCLEPDQESMDSLGVTICRVTSPTLSHKSGAMSGETSGQ
jgi:hypothetical protein